LPAVLAAGSTDVTTLFVSFSAREPAGRDRDYLKWHSLDHRPEQHRIRGLRQSLRFVSTPDCRARRAADRTPYDRVDHVMTYFFTDPGCLEPFGVLSDALTEERRPLSLPSVGYALFELAGKAAAPRAVVGADVLPWRPMLGAYLVLEEGAATPDPALLDAEGVAGAWWFTGTVAHTPFTIDSRGLQLTVLFLDDDPVSVAAELAGSLAQRPTRHDSTVLLAAAFHAIVPFAWSRHLP
jgi:hypothetical protein